MDQAERETTITYDQKDKLVRIFSAIAKDNNKLRKAGFHPVRGNGRDGYCYEVPLAKFRWRIQVKPRTRAATKGSYFTPIKADTSPRIGTPERGCGDALDRVVEGYIKWSGVDG